MLLPGKPLLFGKVACCKFGVTSRVGGSLKAGVGVEFHAHFLILKDPLSLAKH